MANENAKKILKRERAAKKKLKDGLLVLLLAYNSLAAYEKYLAATYGLLIDTFYEGKTLSKPDKTVIKSAAANLTSLVLAAIMYETIYNDKTYEQAAKIATDRAEKKVATIAKTESTRSVNMETMADNKGIQLVWNAILDNRVCPECEALDGEIFDSSKMQPPPLHTNCRCSLEILHSNNR